MDPVPDPELGRRILLGTMTSVLASSALISVRYLANLPAAFSSSEWQIALATRAFRFLLAVLLMRMVYCGSKVAEWIAVILYGLGALMFIPLTLARPSMAVYVVVFGAFPATL